MPITRSMKNQKTQESKQVTDCSISKDNFDVSCSGSRLGVESKCSSSSKRAKAALRLVELKQKQIEYENELKLSAIKNEVEMAKLQVTLAEESDIESSLSVVQDKEADMKRYLNDCKMSVVGTSEENIVVKSKKTVLKVELPKLELSYFDGDPSEYCMFTKQFDSCVSEDNYDSSQRLMYLIYYCRGKAKDAIRGCMMLPPDEGYKKARNVLQDRFGQPHRVGRALIDGVLKGFRYQLNTPDELDELGTRMQNCEIALRQMNYLSELNAIPTLERIAEQLSLKLQDQWAIRAEAIMEMGKEPTFADLTSFVMQRARIYGSRFGQLVREHECRNNRQYRPGKSLEKMPPSTSQNYLINKAQSNFNNECCLCRGTHELEVCERFGNLAVAERWEVLKRQGRCFKCLDDSHNAAGCRSKISCGIDGCQGRHHQLLHSKKDSQPQTNNCLALTGCKRTVRLGTIPVLLKGSSGVIKVVAFLDNGSDTTLINSRLLERLGLNSKPSDLTICTLNGTSVIKSKTCRIEVGSLDGGTMINIEDVYAVPDLPIRATSWKRSEIIATCPHLKDVPLADDDGGDIELLIGCDVPEAHWVHEQRIGGRRQPFATRTSLGWVVHGPINVASQSVSVHCLARRNDTLQYDWKRLYDQEFADIGNDLKCLSVEENEATRIVTAGAQLLNGRYEIPLPWRDSLTPLPDSRPLAMRRLEQLKRKFIRDPQLQERYCDQILQLITKGYANVIDETDPQHEKQRCWYIPHHAVINPKKPEKVRIVFDCAAQWKGLALNDYLYPGPDVTSNLCGILMGFRLNPIAVTADIEEMFLRVKLIESDRGALRFLWWNKNVISGEPVVYKLNVHPFGATSSPFCANLALRKAVNDLSRKNQAGKTDIASTCFYVDDFITSFTDIDTAVEFSRHLTQCLRNCGFKLRRWLCNDPGVLRRLTGVESVPSLLPLTDERTYPRALGIDWNTREDLLQFDFKPVSDVVSRRSILSCVSSLFDPLGLVSPLLLPARVLLQKLCKKGLGWDETIVGEDADEWRSWIDGMSSINKLSLERCIKLGCGSRSVEAPELHIFCDASERGYGVASYGRYHTDTGIRCCLIWGKSRVAPTKAVSIPRLELAAAVLGIRAYQFITRSLPGEYSRTYFWTDSTIVLYYINNTTDRFNTFVANRLAVIHECSQSVQWRYVNTDENPADKASRGCSMNDISIKFWLNGPDFLRQSVEFWPVQPQFLTQPDGIERKTVKTYSIVTADNHVCSYMLNYFSDWFKLLKTVAWWLRYKSYLMIMSGVRRNEVLKTGNIKVTEISHAEVVVVGLAQGHCMPEEYELLSSMPDHTDENYKRIMAKSSLRKLCPIMLNGALCVGGRLNYSNLDLNIKHPMILPKSHHVTDLVLKHYHLLEGHCGTSHLLARLRKKFWVISGRNTVRRITRGCLECKKRLMSVSDQMMSPLPAIRVQPGLRAFSYVGVDYFGPIMVKRGRSLEKRYGCLFTCLQIRAVHIEVAHDLSTDSFLMAFMRFTARRGTPSEVHSDNGTAFVGGEKELRDNIVNLSQTKINNSMLKIGVQWHFNPPAASHRGGVWERMIRSVRKLLSALSREQTLSDEMLSTFLIEAERILNGRPIIPVTEDSSEEHALTPNDLLLLHGNPIPFKIDNLHERYTNYWKRVRYLASVFWRRWTDEYVPLLQVRQKWLSPQRSLKVGDVVLVVSEPRQWGKWPLGVIISTETDMDNLVRTVKVRLAGRELRRDVRKVVLLEGVD